MFKERIFWNIDLVVIDVLFKQGKTNRLAIGDKMNLMTLSGQGHTQFCGYNSTASKSWVTHNSDFHGRISLVKDTISVC